MSGPIIEGMPRGGARSRSGPVPNFDGLARQRDAKTFTRLPKECTRPTPDWPSEVPEPTVGELAMWKRMWALPQAHVWHADRTADTVALYVRQFMEAAKPGASTSLRISVRQLASELLLLPASLHAARYVIVESPEDEILQRAIAATAAATGTDGGSARPGRPSARDRMFLVAPSPGQGAAAAAAEADDPEEEDDDVDPDA